MATQVQIGKHIDLDQARVSRLIRDGVLPPSKPRAGLDLDACRIAYIRYLRGKAAGQVKKGKKPESEESGNYSVLLDKEKYREKKRQNDLEEGLLAPVSILTDAFDQVCSRLIPILESLPLQMKRNWPEITGDEIQLVKKSIAEMRNELADVELDIEALDNE